MDLFNVIYYEIEASGSGVTSFLLHGIHAYSTAVSIQEIVSSRIFVNIWRVVSKIIMGTINIIKQQVSLGLL